jgi:hypothetical protein
MRSGFYNPPTMLLRLTAIVLFISANCANAQTGGTSVFRFLDLTASARQSALGGNVVSVRDNDINAAFNNPAILNPEMDQQITFNYNPYFAGIKHGYTAFAKNYSGVGTAAIGLQFVSYGTFTRTDETAADLGTFSGGDYALSFSLARPIGLDSMLFAGASVKAIYSQIDHYTSFGLAVDLGISYQSLNRLTTAGLVIRNGGMQLKTYYNGNRERLPIEIEAGISQKLSKAPFRFTITARHLEKWDLSYTDPETQNETDPLTGEVKPAAKVTFGNKLLRHFIISNEVLISKNFHLRMAYNFQRRNEMKVDSKPGMVGISFGLGLRVSKFHLSYSRSIYHLAGGTNSLSISTYLGDFKRAK